MRKTALVLLLAAHVATPFAHQFTAAAAQWMADRGWGDAWIVRDVLESVAWLVFAAQAALIACWFSFSSRALIGRLFGAAILLALLGVGVFDVFWRQFGAALGAFQTAMLGAALTMPAYLTVALVLLPVRRSGGWRLRWRTAEPPPLGRPAQFRLRDILGWTFGAALVLGAARWAIPSEAEFGGRTIGLNIYLLLALTGLFFGLHAIPLLWACAWPRRPAVLAVVLALIAVALMAAAEYYGFAWLGFIASRYETQMHFFGAAVHALVFGGTLLAVRACGWRLEKSATIQRSA